MADTTMPATLTPVSEAVQEQIHFDTLWSTAQQALEVYAGQAWSARGDDDPGVTLLQAFAYGVSDISYRHTLPLVDLLTERSVPNPVTDETPRIHLNHDGGIFAREFGPEWALTSSPVTLADYRRAILDLAVQLKSGNATTPTDNVFCFRDVQIAQLPPADSYGYTYDVDHYAFQFVSTSTPEAARYRVSGHYRLWVTLNPGVDPNAAKVALENYLKDHRNLCEWEIVPESFVETMAQEPDIQLVLEDDLPTGSVMNQAVAEAIWAINQALLPLPERRPAADRLAQGERAEQVYSGPRLEHGWLSRLPAERAVVNGQLSAYSVAVQVLSAAVVGVVQGIKAIQWPGTAAIQVAANQQAQLWVDVSKGETLVYAGGHIQVYKRGQQITTSTIDWREVGAIYETLKRTAIQAKTDRLREVPYGRYRNPGFYRSVGASLPPVYGLQQGPDAFDEKGDQNARQLLLFLRSFEQQLANRADQLEKLPRLLAFDGRDPAGAVWGAAMWPRSSDDPLTYEQTQKALQGDHTLGWLYWLVTSLSQDKEKELTILNYLLGYFGEQRASRALVGASFAPEFLPVQQGFLRQVTRLAYERAAISISKVSALQRKIAARLGVGEALFDENLQSASAQFPRANLPFYVIEHQELLPSAPDPSAMQAGWPTEQTVTSAAVSQNELTLALSKGTALKRGQLIELQGTLKTPVDNDDSKSMEPLTAIVIHEVTDGKVVIDLKEHARLQRSVPLLTDGKYNWHWRLAQSWLKRVVYDYELAEGAPYKKDATTIILKVSPSFPVELVKSQRFALRPKGRWQYWPTKADLKDSTDQNDIVVEVVAADPILGTVTVKWVAQVKPDIQTDPEPKVGPVNLRVAEDGKPVWPNPKDATFHYAWSVPYANESFSFTLSVVLNRDWLKDSKSPGELSQWIEQIVREEMPSHLNLQLHWLSDFNSFATRYQGWQSAGRPVGDQSYELLRLLGIGERPVDERAGIGFVHVASADESKKVEDATGQITPDADHDRALQKYSVVYVRKTGFKLEGTS